MAYAAVACNSFGVSMKSAPAIDPPATTVYIVSYTILMLLCLLCQSARLMANKLFHFIYSWRCIYSATKIWHEALLALISNTWNHPTQS